MEIAKLETILENDGIIFLTCAGFLTQSLIVGMTEALAKESKVNDISVKVSNNILTIFIELSQNIMNYAKKTSLENTHDPKSMIIVGFDKNENNYYIFSRNVVSNEDKDKIISKIEEVLPMDKDELKKLYREVRRTGKGKHEKGAGIGFLEVAKRCDAIEYNFSKIDEETNYYAFKAIINNN